MKENHHYKGNFEFKFYPTNQRLIIKSFLKDNIPAEIRKAAKSISWDSLSNEEQKSAEQNAHLLLTYCSSLGFFKSLGQESVNVAVGIYHILNNICESPFVESYFNVKDDLALAILRKYL